MQETKYSYLNYSWGFDFDIHVCEKMSVRTLYQDPTYHVQLLISRFVGNS